MRATLSYRLLIGLLGSFASSAHCSEAKFQTEKTYPNEAAFESSFKKPFVLVSSNSLSFFDANAHQASSVTLGGQYHNGTDPLGRDGWSTAQFAIAGRNGAVLIELSSGYESCGTSTRFFSLAGDELGRAQLPSCTYRVSPRGDRVISARSRGYNYLPKVSLIGTKGELVGEFAIDDGSGGTPGFAFSNDGALGAIFYSGARVAAGGGIAIFSPDGKEQGRFTSPTWTPISYSIENDGLLGWPVAVIDPINLLIVAEGIEGVPSKRSVRAVSFAGKELWQMPRPNENCKATLLLKARSKSSILAEVCEANIILTEVDSLSGKILKTTASSITSGGILFARATISPDEKLVAINLRKKEPDGSDSMWMLVFDEKLGLAWKSRAEDVAVDNVRFSEENSIVVTKGSLISVGRLVYE